MANPILKPQRAAKLLDADELPANYRELSYGNRMPTQRPATASVIRWEPFGWGVAITYGSGKKHDAYPVGPSREEAETEAKRVRSGGRPRGPRDVIRVLTGQRLFR